MKNYSVRNSEEWDFCQHKILLHMIGRTLIRAILISLNNKSFLTCCKYTKYLLKVIEKLTSVNAQFWKITQVSQVYKTMLKWSHFNPICTKMFRGIFTQSFDAFWGHSKIFKIKRKVFSATASIQEHCVPRFEAFFGQNRWFFMFSKIQPKT